MMAVVFRSKGYVGKDMYFMARITARDGTGTPVLNEGNALKNADVSTITVTIWDLQAPLATYGVPVATWNQRALTPTTTVLSDTLTADNVWVDQHQQVDTIGRNFLHQVPGTVFAAANHTYRIFYECVLTGGTLIGIEFEHTTQGTTPT